MILAPTLTLSAGSGAAIVRPSFSRDFAGEKTLNNGTGPAITFTRASNATFFDADGVLQTATTDAPRFDHDPATGASRGLLIEESRTNSIRNSQAGGSTNGVLGSGGVAPTNWVVIDGGATAEVVGTGTAAGFFYMDVKVSGTTSFTTGAVYFETSTQVVAAKDQTWTGSYWAALIGGSNTNITTFRAAFLENDSSGVFLTSGNTNHSLTSSLVRYTGTRTLTEASTARVRFGIGWAHSSSVAVDFTLRIAAPQLEQGAFATSYIPTTTAAATRAADSAVVTPISSFYNASEGTLFAEGIAQQATSVGSPAGQNISASLLTFNISTDNTGNQGINNALLYRPVTTSNGGFYYGVGGAGQATITQSGFTQGSIVKLAGAYALNNFAASVAGAAVGTDTSGSVGLAANTMRIGKQTSAPSGFFNGHIRKVAYWPKRLTNTLLEQLTT